MHAAVGGSLGGMQALQWSLDHPDEVERAVLVCCTARLTAQNIAFTKVAREAIMRHDAMDVARMMAHITYLSVESMGLKFDRARRVPDAPMTFDSDYEVEHYLDHQAEIFLARFDPLTYLYLSRVMDYFEPFAEHVARTPSTGYLLVSFDSDWRFGTEHSEFIEDAAARARRDVARHEVASPWGHDSFLMDVPGVPRARATVHRMIPTVAWTGGALEILDQTRLPEEEVVLRLTTADEVIEAIQRLAVRGAPAIGVAGAFGAVLAPGDAERIASARPTARTCAGRSSG